MAAEVMEKKETKVAVKHDTELSKGIWGSSDTVLDDERWKESNWSGH